jgi:protein-disulfide isomerase
MRLTAMKPSHVFLAALAIAMSLPLAAVPMLAQQAAPPGTGQTFKDTSMIKPPPGAKVAIVEFEDLECPACRAAHPKVVAALDYYKIPFIRKDYPLGGAHIWSADAAVWARYLQEKVSPKVCDDYRTAVFESQPTIASKDDLLNFTRRFFQSHNLQMPFVVDPTGDLRKEVFADKAVGEKLGLTQTPTIFVCTDHSWVQVTDPSVLDQTIEKMEAQVGATPPVKKAGH